MSLIFQTEYRYQTLLMYRKIYMPWARTLCSQSYTEMFNIPRSSLRHNFSFQGHFELRSFQDWNIIQAFQGDNDSCINNRFAKRNTDGAFRIRILGWTPIDRVDTDQLGGQRRHALRLSTFQKGALPRCSTAERFAVYKPITKVNH